MLWWDHCIIFPFYENGRIVYLQARHLNGNVKSKYIGLVGIRKPIFNLDLLKKIKQGSSVYLCEGVIDAMSAVQLGLPAIAVLGASSYHDDFTKILLPFNVHIIPDSDAAGLKLLNRVRDAFAEYGRAVSIVNLGKQKDVNEYLVERTL